MATLADLYTLSTVAAFIQKVEVALVKAAIAIMAEVDSTADHAIRKAYATRVLADPAGQAAKVAVGIVTGGGSIPTSASAPAGATATDADIEFTVNSMFTAYAR